MKVFLFLFASLFCGVQALIPASVAQHAETCEPANRYMRTSTTSHTESADASSQYPSLQLSTVTDFYNSVYDGAKRMFDSLYATIATFGTTAPTTTTAAATHEATATTTTVSSSSSEMSGSPYNYLTPEAASSVVAGLQGAAQDALQNIKQSLPKLEDHGVDAENISKVVTDTCNTASKYCSWLNDKATHAINGALRTTAVNVTTS
ncbi:uncharacterized protein BXIN_0952 [Babesia sp. Xinjiang]|uniref:uncharacterized protein n=1 Tax=Babesia sp. Xinjiang TaxID=462227 RepID=UPI000A256C71|nr:uncharacterized protein BXIN_0952 [Babesia sp. Xinjiang]ORM42084.1 hypothetical protein BXIN_0952 [Babesia sp. Xinjiang]